MQVPVCPATGMRSASRDLCPVHQVRQWKVTCEDLKGPVSIFQEMTHLCDVQESITCTHTHTERHPSTVAQKERNFTGYANNKWMTIVMVVAACSSTSPSPPYVSVSLLLEQVASSASDTRFTRATGGDVSPCSHGIGIRRSKPGPP